MPQKSIKLGLKRYHKTSVFSPPDVAKNYKLNQLKTWEYNEDFLIGTKRVIPGLMQVLTRTKVKPNKFSVKTQDSCVPQQRAEVPPVGPVPQFENHCSNTTYLPNHIN